MPLLAVKGIRTKIIGAMVLLLVFIGLISFWVSYMHEKKSLLTNMQDNAIILNRALIISITNQKSIAEKVNLLLDDAELRQKLGDQGRADVLARFDWEVIDRRYTDLIRSFWFTSGS